MKNIKLVKVQGSSSIASVGFDTGTMLIKFKRGTIYAYSVTKEFYDEFMNSESKGKFFSGKMQDMEFRKVA